MTEELTERRDPATGELLKPGAHGRYLPFEVGNRAAAKHGFWSDPSLRDDDRAEVAEIAVSIVDALPDYQGQFGFAVEQLALKVWRQRRAYRDLSEHGVLRDGKPAPVLVDLSKLENAIARDLDALGLTPTSRARLGLDIARTGDVLAEYLEQAYPGAERG